MYFLNFFLYYVAWFSQTKYIVIVTKKGSTKNLNMMSPGAGVLVLGRCHISHVVKMHSSLLPGIDQTNYVYRNDDQGRVYQNCKLEPPGQGILARAWPYVI